MVSGCRFPVSVLVRGLTAAALIASFVGAYAQREAQTELAPPRSKSNLVMAHGPIHPAAPVKPAAPVEPIAPVSNPVQQPSAGSGVGNSIPHFRNTTNAQRRAAAANLARRRAGLANSPLPKARAQAIVGIPGNALGPATLDQLYFSGVYPNYANSPLPNLNDTTNCPAPNFCGIRKFVDTLPLLNTANDLGNMLPVAVPDTTTFPGSDYYEISLVQFRQQLHKDLPAVSGAYPNQAGGTLLRGYVQTNGPNGASQLPYYLGPIIVAQSNRPVRVKFTNALPTGTGGNLFIPTDLSSLGAGLGLANGQSPYLQNRATIHMHGGNTPWISDGTPHQWTIPAGDWLNTKYPRGASVQFVPDMFFVNGVVVPQCSATVTTGCSDPTGVNNATTLPAGATNDPGNGALTFYYTNQQSGRLLFYHDHAYGITRLNVYAGEASAMLIQDQIDADLTTGSNNSGVFTLAGVTPAPVIPAEQIPLVIQDKTFVPQNPTSTTISSISLLDNGSGYTTATVAFTGGCTTEPVATPVIGPMMDPYGQYISGAITGFTVTSWGSGCTSDPIVSITGDGAGAVAFASVATLSQQDPTWDTAQWGGYGNFWYPHVYMTNQWPGNPDSSGTNPMGRWDYASWFWPPFNGNPGQYTVRGELPCPTAYDPSMTCPGIPSVLAPAPVTEIDGSVHQGQGSTVSLTPEGFMDTPIVNGVAYPVLTVDPKPYRFRILSIANERSFNLSWFQACGLAQYTPTVGATCPAPVAGTGVVAGTEVGMVPSATTAGFPVQWPSDGRAGGVPDPAGMGPNWIVIGTEGGVLPKPAVIPPTPVSYEQNMRSITVTNVQNHGLLLMSAERSDAIVDFTAYAGKTLILYNDSPAPMPAHDDRNDYYTGDADNTGTGGAPSTLPGFGPNTRTIMQVIVRGSVTGAAEPAVNMATLNAVIPKAFNLVQPVPVVPEPVYNAAYGQTFKPVYPALQSTNLTFTPIDPTTKQLSTIVTNNGGAGSTTVTLDLRFKTIQELFDLDYGRMNATLGTELPLTNYNTQTTIPLGYVDPFTEDIYDSANVQASPVGIGADGSQVWIIVHNGVDSHAIHFHLYDVQLIDRYGWDGTLRVPFPEEQGWKDTLRMNPLEMDFVALRPVSQTLPFPVPDSARLFDVTKPAGTDVAMSNVDPINGAAPQINQFQPMGWEYVWHCHLLGHEENDMMREQVFQVPPQAPANVAAVASLSANVITFTDKSLSEAGFNIRRADDAAMTVNVRNFPAAVGARTGWNTTATWRDNYSATTLRGKAYYYQVQSFKPDADYWTPIIGPLSGPTQGVPATLANLVSPWSGIATLTQAPIISVNPTSLTFNSQAYMTTSAAKAITVTSAGAVNLLLGAPSIGGANAGDFIISANTCPVNPNPLATTLTCTISVTFKPTYAGTRNAALVIPSNDPTNPSVNVLLTGTGGQIPLTITAPTQSLTWSPTLTPAYVPVVTPTPPDPLSSFGLNCSSPYVVPGGPAGTYTTSCSATTNPNNAYAMTFVTGRLTVSRTAAAMISPTPGSVLSTSQTFTWTTGGAAQTYALNISAVGPGKTEIFTTGWYTGTSVTVPLAATGKTLYVTLGTMINGTWQWTNYTYTAPPPPVGVKATLISPTTGPLAATTTFQWTTGTNVTYYGLSISTTSPGVGVIYSSGWLTTTSVTVNNIPQGITLYVQVMSLINGVWQYSNYTF